MKHVLNNGDVECGMNLTVTRGVLKQSNKAAVLAAMKHLTVTRGVLKQTEKTEGPCQRCDLTVTRGVLKQ